MSEKDEFDRAGETDTRMPPDPFSAVLPAIAALGAIASIAAIHWSGQEKTAQRTRTKRKTAASLRDLETCCLGLQRDFPALPASPPGFRGRGRAGLRRR